MCMPPQMVMQLGGLDAVLAVMQRHAENLQILQHGCWVLDNLSLDEANRITILDKGGVDMLRILLARFRNLATLESEVGTCHSLVFLHPFGVLS